MKNLTISKKINISFVVLLTISMLTNVYTLSNLKEAGNMSKDLLEELYVVINQTMGVRKDIASIDKNVMNAIFIDNPIEYQTLDLRGFDSINERINILRDSPIENEKLVDNLENSVVELRQQYERISNAIDQGDYDSAKRVATNEDSEYYQTYDRCEELAIALYKHAEVVGIEYNKKVQDTVSTAWYMSMAISGVSVVLGVVIALYMTKSLKKPVEEIKVKQGQKLI